MGGVVSKFLCQLRHTLLPGNREDPAFDSGIPTCPQQDYQLSGRFSQADTYKRLTETLPHLQGSTNYHRCHLLNCKWKGKPLPLWADTWDPIVSHSMQSGGPGPSTAGPYGQDAGYYSQKTRPHDYQLVSFPKGEWPLGQELPWGEAVIYCPLRAPCFQKDSPYCKAIAPSGQKTPKSQEETPQNEAPAPQEAMPSADTGGTRTPNDDHGVSSQDGCGSSVQSMEDESEGEPLSDMEVDSSTLPAGQPSIPVAAHSGQKTMVQATGSTQQSTAPLANSKRKRHEHRVQPYPNSKKKRPNTTPGPTSILVAPVPVLTMQMPPASQPVAPNQPAPQLKSTRRATHRPGYQPPIAGPSRLQSQGTQPLKRKRS